MTTLFRAAVSSMKIWGVASVEYYTDTLEIPELVLFSRAMDRFLRKDDVYRFQKVKGQILN